MEHVFLWIIRNCNHKEGQWNGITIKRGQLVTGLFKISEKTGCSIQTVRTCLKRLKSTNEIKVEPTNQYSKITVCNYDIYQSKPAQTDQPENDSSNKPVTNEQQTDNKPVTTNKKEKNGRMEEVQTPIVPKGDFAPAALELFSGPPSLPSDPNGKHLTEARVLVHYLNERAGRQHRETDKNLKLITSRLNEPGVTVDGIKQMIDHQVAQWGRDQQMRKYLRVETLFRESKFESYYASRNERVETVKPF